MRNFQVGVHVGLPRLSLSNALEFLPSPALMIVSVLCSPPDVEKRKRHVPNEGLGKESREFLLRHVGEMFWKWRQSFAFLKKLLSPLSLNMNVWACFPCAPPATKWAPAPRPPFVRSSSLSPSRGWASHWALLSSQDYFPLPLQRIGLQPMPTFSFISLAHRPLKTIKLGGQRRLQVW